MVFGLKQWGVQFIIYHTRGEHTGQYTTDVVIPASTIYRTRGEYTGQYTTDVVIPTSTI
jgi:hypothetical protein